MFQSFIGVVYFIFCMTQMRYTYGNENTGDIHLASMQVSSPDVSGSDDGVFVDKSTINNRTMPST